MWNYDEQLANSLQNALDAFVSRCEALQARYDERSDNEPEYESQVERWQEALDRLEEQIDELTELNEQLEEIVDQIDEEDAELTAEELKALLDGYENFNAEYHGLTPLMKPLHEALYLYPHTKWNQK